MRLGAPDKAADLEQVVVAKVENNHRTIRYNNGKSHRNHGYTRIYYTIFGWWFGTFGLFFHIWDVIRHPLTFIFFREVETTNQLYMTWISKGIWIHKWSTLIIDMGQPGKRLFLFCFSCGSSWSYLQCGALQLCFLVYRPH